MGRKGKGYSLLCVPFSLVQRPGRWEKPPGACFCTRSDTPRTPLLVVCPPSPPHASPQSLPDSVVLQKASEQEINK